MNSPSKYSLSYYQAHTDHYFHMPLQMIPSFQLIRTWLHPTSRDKILDAGCGTGYLLDFVTPTQATGIGVDVSIDAIRVASSSFPRLSFQVSRLESLPFASLYFDKILCFNVIEHINNQEKAMKELIRVLKPGGTLVIGTNIRDSLSWKLFTLLYGGDTTHTREFSVDEFLSFVSQYIRVKNHQRSSCIARFSPGVNTIIHKFLKGDILVKAIKQ